MTEQDDARTVVVDRQMLEEIVGHFNHGMQLREEMSSRIARRVTLIIRAMAQIAAQTRTVDYRASNISDTLHRVTGIILYMEYDVDQLARPTRLFP